MKPAHRSLTLRLGRMLPALVAAVLISFSASAAEKQDAAAAKGDPDRDGNGARPVLRQWTIDGVAREALVYAPASAKEEPAPLIFAFHGHGGTMKRSVNRYRFHELWPEAITVCPQGLNTPGRLTDPEGRKPGWQSQPGHMNDRDLKFFDAMLASLKADYQVDETRIYSTGHSNGGGFTYLLWFARGDTFAAVAPTACGLKPEYRPGMKPKPVLHLAGKKDPLVKFEWQQDAINFLRQLNQTGEGQPWPIAGADNAAQFCTLYEPKPEAGTGAEVVTIIHPGAHNYPNEASRYIVKFFQAHTKSDEGSGKAE